MSDRKPTIKILDNSWNAVEKEVFTAGSTITVDPLLDDQYEDTLTNDISEVYTNRITREMLYDAYLTSPFFEKYGNYPLALDEFKEKGKKTSLERYGVDHPMKSSLIKMRMPEVKSAYEKLLSNNKSIPLVSFEEYVARNDNLDKSVLFRCLNCGKEFTSNCNGYNHTECPDCFPIFINSEPQQEIYLFLKNECNFEIIENSRSIISPLELDIYIPEKNLAIEFDGLYWHSEKCGKDSKYHLNKTKLCEEKNIQLIHIFDDEWRNKQDI